MRSEISHGREYLFQVRRQLKENRQLLEEWAQYEAACALQPLDHLVQSASLKGEVERFLVGWLERHQKQLEEVSHEMEQCRRATRKSRRRR